MRTITTITNVQTNNTKLKTNIFLNFTKLQLLESYNKLWGRRGRERIVVGFTATCAISTYHH